MTVALVATGLGALLAAGAAASLARRRTLRREAQRVAALTAVARRLDAAVASLRATHEPPPPAPPAPAPPVAPVIDGRLPGRAALLDALREGVERARADGSRLTAAVVQLDVDAGDEVGDDVRALAGVPVYAVGPRALALVLPGCGRAGALGVLARIEAERGPSGRAVELAEGEDAAALATRLLGPSQPSFEPAPPGGTDAAGTAPGDRPSRGQSPGRGL